MRDRDVALTLHLVRHAHAGEPTDWSGPDDSRPLTEKGERQARRLGQHLAACDLRPSAIATSPRARAARTAELIGAAFELPVSVDPRLAGPLGLAELEAIVREMGDAPMLVGHEPDLSSLVRLLIDAAGIEMRKGALASVGVTLPLRRGGGVLRRLLPPDAIAHG